MDLFQLLEKYPIPVSIVSSILIMWSLSKFVFPHLPNLTSWLTASKDSEIKDLKERLIKLEQNQKELLDRLKSSERRENQMLGLLRGLSFQLKSVDVDIDSEIDKILNFDD